MLPRESGRLEAGDLVVYAPLPAGGVPGLASWAPVGNALNVRYAEAALASLAGGEPGWPRGRQLVRLARDLGARWSGIAFRPLWLELESAQYWGAEGARPALAARALQRALQGWERLYEREPLAGAQEGAQQFPRLAELSALACGLSVLQ